MLQPLTHRIAKALDAPSLHQIFEPCLLPVLTIPMIALDLDNRLHDREHRCFSYHAKRLSKGRMGIWFQWSTAKPSPDQHIKPINASRRRRVNYGDQPNVVGVWEGAVVLGYPHADLEFSR